MGFVSGIIHKTQINEATIKMGVINFLCVHKKLRAKRLAPVLIKEITRRINLTNVWQAIYTSGEIMPLPFGSTVYFHKALNIKKCCEIGFSPMP